MNRQILFRGRKGNIWYFGDLQHDQDGNCFISFNDLNAYRVMFVDSETVGQFTGLIDQKGQQIFEGDIVSDQDSLEQTAVVEWFNDLGHDGGAALHPGFYAKKWMDDDRYHDTNFYEPSFENCVVVGNIHDNPGLMEQKNGQTNYIPRETYRRWQVD